MKLKSLIAAALMFGVPAAFAADLVHVCEKYKIYLDGNDRSLIYDGDGDLIGEWHDDEKMPLYFDNDGLYFKWYGKTYRCEK